MKLQILHLSDLHIDGLNAAHEIKVDKIENALNSTENADEFIVLMSGDLAANGKNYEYKCVGSLLGAIFKRFGRGKFYGKHFEFVCTPGNHDMNFNQLTRGYKEITEATESDSLSAIINKDIDAMDAFWKFSKDRKCFVDNKSVSKQVFEYDKHRVGFIMVNSAPLSLLGGNAQDMGIHYLTEDQLKEIEDATEAEINILVMHHSIEWFTSSCKERLRSIISRKYALLLTGHEHEPVGESRMINVNGSIQCVQGNALRGYSKEGNGFCEVTMDLAENTMKAQSFIWEEDLYISKTILNSNIKKTFHGDIQISPEFLTELEYDNNKNRIDEYFVFPSLTYNIYTEAEEIEKHDIEREEELIELIETNNRIVIRGEQKSGKTILARKIFQKLFYLGKTPLLLTASEITKLKMSKAVLNAFNEQYLSEKNAYERFLQLPKGKKVVLLDEADLINKKTFNRLMQYLENNFSTIIVFCEEKINFDIRNQVVDALVDEKTIQMSIKPFLYLKRKELISNVLHNGSSGIENIDKEVRKINELINVQVKYFNLSPEFIIHFVRQYEKDYRFQFSSGMNVFNIVYESSIKNKIINNSKSINPTLVLNVLRELAYYMHFNKIQFVKYEEILNVIKEYNEAYRQNISVRLFVDAALNSKILVETVNEFRFKDHALVAYFVAQALNQKYNHGEHIDDNLDSLLKNLCFSINSDIVLFLALITNNPKFINVIIEGAKNHFNEQEELSFDKENVKFLLNTNIPVKKTLPTEEERIEREALITKQEEEVRLSDLIELVNEYDYTEDDLLKIENQVMISFKYLEILSKALPAFCQNMKVNQQDRLVELIYKCPNQFLFMLLKDIGENFDEFTQMLYDDVSELRREKNIAKVNIESVKQMVEQISSGLVVTLYQFIAGISVSEQSISALNAFDYKENSNYQLMNLIMQSSSDNVNLFSRRAQKLDKELDKKLEKSIIKYAVRNFFLRNNVEIYGEAQSLLDHFFRGQYKQKIKMEMVKKRLTDN
ncbi:Calcineurin-like phosphoesterase [Dethiosulfatibacter aminovorans DSM 17477]|uniref:Calcineurin-like phosphoesterase n=1 Tax=Dethiosulfatibacter aminovorans DSM 17477 TaxID=1121476 RepID=A0A1M6EMC1_9FIRM|nr:metallophosphoesterase [Dethiosulfatibacter aminovorans]SHI86667.1 Calcineurin-like phosphoesterase [Dethiosulfatibacter aminovorans DSM 17477]